MGGDGDAAAGQEIEEVEWDAWSPARFIPTTPKEGIPKKSKKEIHKIALDLQASLARMRRHQARLLIRVRNK